ncbi:MAG: multicopper oxidase domain-containing protein [Longimicrobiales bacterium]
MCSRRAAGAAILFAVALATTGLSAARRGITLGETAAPLSARAARALPNDNIVPAGRLVDGVFTLRLEARQANWYPEDSAGAAIPVFAFAETGEAASIPGPMIRVPAGTELRVAVRNTLPKTLTLRGLRDRAESAADSIVIQPGATHELRFRAATPGTYYYWGRTEPNPPNSPPTAVPRLGIRHDATLAGAFIVDAPGTSPAPDEQVFVITAWADTSTALGVKSDHADRILRREGIPRDHWLLLAVNGRSWPYTERLSYTIGDTVRWRVINGSPFPHPMHLHGFYFAVDARGDAMRDTVYAPAQRRTVVTEWLAGGTTMALTWIPTRPGNWLFHCHIVTHISDANRLASGAAGRSTNSNHAEHAMGGLVIGVRVSPARDPASVQNAQPRRKLRVFVTQRANVYGVRPGYSYVLQEGPTPPAPDSIRALSSTLVLHENEPTEITVINAATHHTTVHWHGMELESFYDGVGDWSGWGERLAPPIAAGDSFVVRLTPPRAGTFIYHTHVNEGIELASGLYGALLVLPENASLDAAERDVLLLLSIGGPHDDARPLVNGSTAPPPIQMRAGVPRRFRFINISPLETHRIQLTSGGIVQEWRALAKDGAELAAHQATTQSAALVLHPGETYDFEVVRPRPETLVLTISSVETIANRAAARARGVRPADIPRILTEIPVVVR